MALRARERALYAQPGPPAGLRFEFESMEEPIWSAGRVSLPSILARRVGFRVPTSHPVLSRSAPIDIVCKSVT